MLLVEKVWGLLLHAQLLLEILHSQKFLPTFTIKMKLQNSISWALTRWNNSSKPTVVGLLTIVIHTCMISTGTTLKSQAWMRNRSASPPERPNLMMIYIKLKFRVAYGMRSPQAASSSNGQNGILNSEHPERLLKQRLRSRVSSQLTQISPSQMTQETQWMPPQHSLSISATRSLRTLNPLTIWASSSTSTFLQILLLKTTPLSTSTPGSERSSASLISGRLLPALLELATTQPHKSLTTLVMIWWVDKWMAMM